MEMEVTQPCIQGKVDMCEMPLCKDACTDCSLLHLNKSTAQSKDSAQKGGQRQ